MNNHTKQHTLFLQDQPAVWSLIGVVAGISAYYISLSVSFSIAIISLVAFILFLAVLRFTPGRLVVFVLWCCIGAYIGSGAYNTTAPQVERGGKPLIAFLDGEILSAQEKAKGVHEYIVSGTIDGQQLPRLYEREISLTVFPERDSSLPTLPMLKAGTHIRASVQLQFPRKKVLPTDTDEFLLATAREVYAFATAKSHDVRPYNVGNNTIHDFFSGIGNSIKKQLLQMMPQKEAGIAIGIVTGDKRYISREEKQIFSVTGTAHILAVSGLHVGIIATVLLSLVGFSQHKLLKFTLFVLGIAMFAGVTGVAPSTLRAGIMAVFMYGLYLLERETKLLNILAATIVVILLVSPELLFSAGFQMSVGALLGIALALPHFQKIMSYIFPSKFAITKTVGVSMAVTFAASVFTSPLTAHYFGVFSLISPLANVIIIPLMSAAMIYSLIGVLLSFLWMPAGELFTDAAFGFISVSNKLNVWFAELPYAVLQGEDILPVVVLISVLALYIAWANTRTIFLFRCAIACCAAMLWYNISPKNSTILPPNNVIREGFSATYHPLGKNEAVFILKDTDTSAWRRADDAWVRYVRERYPKKYIFTYGHHSLLHAAFVADQGDTIIAHTLSTKKKAMFRALDTISAREVTLLNAANYRLQGKKAILLADKDSIRLWENR